MQAARPSSLLSPGRRRRHASGGFTIIEVAMASFILAFGIATSIIALQTGFKFIDVARDTTLASQILQSEIERIRMMSWGTVDALIPAGEEKGTETVNLATMFTSDVNLANRFTVVRTVTRDTTRINDVRFITLQVTWESLDGRNHSRSFQAKYIKNGLYDYYYTLARP